MMDIEILRFRTMVFPPGEKSTGVSKFNANVNGFGIRGGTLRRNHATGDLFVETYARGEHGKGVTLQRGPVRDELTSKLIELFEGGAQK